MGQATPSAIRATYLSCMLSSQATCVILSGFRAALDLNTYPLRNVHGALNGLNLVEVSQYACWLFRLFSRHISRTQSFQQNHHIIFLARVALKLLVSLMSRPVACSARIVADRHRHNVIDTYTHRTTTVTLAAHARRGLVPLYPIVNTNEAEQI